MEPDEPFSWLWVGICPFVLHKALANLMPFLLFLIGGMSHEVVLFASLILSFSCLSNVCLLPARMPDPELRPGDSVWPERTGLEVSIV